MTLAAVTTERTTRLRGRRAKGRPRGFLAPQERLQLLFPDRLGETGRGPIEPGPQLADEQRVRDRRFDDVEPRARGRRSPIDGTPD
jgi:hypothetical protein